MPGDIGITAAYFLLVAVMILRHKGFDQSLRVIDI